MLNRMIIIFLTAVFYLSTAAYLYSEQFKCVYSDWLRGTQCQDNISKGQCSYLEGKYTPGKCSPEKKAVEKNTKKYTPSQRSCLEKCYPGCTMLNEYDRKTCNQSCKAQCWVYD